MTGLIRSNSERASAVRSVDSNARPALQPIMLDPLALERDRLADEVARLQAALADMARREATATADLDAARALARRQGHEAGRAEGLAEGTANLERLEGGIRQAQADFNTQLDAMECLAAALAEVAVDRIFASESGREDRIVGTLRSAAARLGGQAIMRVVVSPEDFPDGPALARLTTALAPAMPEIDIVLAADLGRGQARFALHLGEAEVGPAQQWRVLAAELARQAGDIG